MAEKKKPRFKCKSEAQKKAIRRSYAIKNAKNKFPHFRKYFKSRHPALILNEQGQNYRFRRVTSSKFSGHHLNEEVIPNPDKNRDEPMYIVKQIEEDNKKRFSLWTYPWEYPKK